MLLMKTSVVVFALSFFSAGATSALFATDAGIDISRIIDKPAAESVLDTKVKDPAARNVQGGDGYYSKCNYYSVTPGKALLLRLYQAANGYDPQEELDAVTKGSPALIEILGLGDKALMSNGTASGLQAHALMLYVLKGNALVTVGLSGIEDDKAAMEKAKSVAAKIVAQL